MMCGISLGGIRDEIDQFVSEIADIFVDEEDVTKNNNKEEEKLLVQLNDMIFSKSYSGDVFTVCNIDERIVQEMLDTWFEIDEDEKNTNIPKENLYSSISKLSYERRKPHNSEWFKEHLSTVRFHYINKQLIPYKYSVHK